MAMTMDIRLNYGGWPGDEGDTTESAGSLEATPALYQTGEADGLQPDNTSRLRQPSDLSISDLFSDSEDTVPDQDLLNAEINMGSAASTANSTSHYTSNSQTQPHRTDPLNTIQTSTYNFSVIDLTESPPQPSPRPNPTPTPLPENSQPTSQQQSTMPPTLRSHVQSRRAQPEPAPPPRSEERPRKRRRLSQSQRSAEVEQPQQQPVTNDNPAEVEAVDLTDVNDESDLSKAISKQQQDAVQAQMKDSAGEEPQGRTPLSSYKCPICMDTPEDATSTICGHLFCHKCILDTLRFSEQTRRDHRETNKATKGTCPVCRKPLARKDEPGAGRTLVPLEIKLSTKRDLKGKGVVGRNGDSGKGGRLNLKAKTEREASEDMWREYTNLEHG